MPIPRLELKEALQNLRQAAKDLFLAIEENEITDEEIKNQYATVDSAIASVDGIMAGEGEKTDFKQFFHEVGRSLVGAQEMLDEESGAYLKRIQSGARDYIQPAVFRIPRLKADVKFAFEKVSREGVNLIFYRRTQQAKEQHQQSLSFELASAPPPPEVVARLRQIAPAIELVLVPADRKAILERLPAQEPPLTRKIDLPRVLIWPAAGAQEFFLARALKTDADNKVGIWHLVLSGQEPELKEVVAFKATVPSATRLPLRAWVLKLAEAQFQYLESLK